MPSSRRQINVRIDAETAERIECVQVAASAGVGLKLSLSDLFRLGLIELEKKYPSKRVNYAVQAATAELPAKSKSAAGGATKRKKG
jgi:hypothetical protein